jgi:hypothetical protein
MGVVFALDIPHVLRLRPGLSGKGHWGPPSMPAQITGRLVSGTASGGVDAVIRPFHLIRICAAVVVVGLLSGCNALKLGYNHVDQVAFWWLDGYVRFDDSQNRRVREDISRLHRWHRNQELPQLVALLASAAQLATGNVTTDQTCALAATVRDRIGAVADQMEPAAVTLALGLSAGQLLNLQTKYEDNNRDYRKEWIALDPGSREDKRLRMFQDRIESMYGSLDEGQVKVLRGELQNSVFDPALQLRLRQRRQADILQTLRRLAGQPMPLAQARTEVHGLLQRGLLPTDHLARSHQEAALLNGCQTLAAVHNSTTPRQRQFAVRRLRAYQRDLEELAVEP